MSLRPSEGGAGMPVERHGPPRRRRLSCQRLTFISLFFLFIVMSLIFYHVYFLYHIVDNCSVNVK